MDTQVVAEKIINIVLSRIWLDGAPLPEDYTLSVEPDTLELVQAVLSTRAET